MNEPSHQHVPRRSVSAMRRQRQRLALTRAAPVVGVSALLLGALIWPLLFTYSGFAGDWDHHLWLMWHQSLSIKYTHFPSFFLNSAYSVFYPTYAFYGGTLYAIGALLSLALGEAPVQAYVLIFTFDFIAAFGGWYWLGRMAGVGRWWAMVPGLVFITSAYYMLVIYLQGDWPEFTGISMIPLMLAAALSVLRADRWRAASALALAVSSVLFFGSHNITIMLALSMFALTSVVVLICIPNARRSITRRGLVRVAAVVVPSALVSAWYLLPVLAYHSSTRISSEYIQAREELTGNVWLVALKHLFTFNRSAAPSMSLPTLAIVWVLASIVILPRGACNRTWTRLLLICSAIAMAIAIAMTHPRLLLSLPRPYTLIQYSYRLEAYVLLALCGAILAALVLARSGTRAAVRGSAAQRRVRVWQWMAIPVCAVSLGGAVQQISSLPYPGPDRYVTMQYFGEVVTGDNRDFQDATAPVIAGHGLATVTIPPESVHDDRASFSTRQPAGTLIATNIGAGSNLVQLTGAKAVGTDSETGNMVLQVGRVPARALPAKAASAPGAPQTITVSTANSLPVLLGRILTLVGLAILLLELLLLPAWRYLTRLLRASRATQRNAQRQAVDRAPL